MKGARIAVGAEGIDIGQPWVDLCRHLPLDAAIAILAERQHGVVALHQLQFLGLGKAAVAKRAQDGRLHRVHRGVYAVRHPGLTPHGRWMAATIAGGPEALLSHRAAAALCGLWPGAMPAAEITLPPGARLRPGIQVHRSRTVTEADRARQDGIPCTSVARTLVDLGDVAGRRAVERAVSRAENLRIFDLGAVREVLDRAGRRRGAALLRSVLESYAGPTLTDEELEEWFLGLCRAAGLPAPEVNSWLVLREGIAYKADFLWRAEGLIVETDGYGSHGSRRAFEHDRARDQRLTVAGFTVLRVTWRQLTDDAAGILASVEKLLARLARP